MPYPSENEIEKILADQEGQKASFDLSYGESFFFSVQDEITDPLHPENPIRYKVADITVTDSLPQAQFPEESYVTDYDSAVAPLLNEDGTLKSHERYSPDAEDTTAENIETVGSKFITATVEITNTEDSSQEAYITPMLELLKTDDAGEFERFYVQPASAAYASLSVEGEPLFQSIQQFTGSRKKHVRFAEIGAGETLECTFAWVVDDDCTDNAYLAFFDMCGSGTNSYPRVKATG